MANPQTLALTEFDSQQVGLSKGSLSLVLTLTRMAQAEEFPLGKDMFVTAGGGQVSGLGGGAVKKILTEHGIVRILSNEGGRTSRGNMERMSAYIDVLNNLAKDNQLDLVEAEKFWVERVVHFFDALPFTFKFDASQSMQACIRDLLAQTVERQREASGTMYAGAVMQHLVGASLDYMTKGSLAHNGFAVADAPLGRVGDFLVGDVAIHVTTAPGEALLRKCQSNLQSSLRPIIVTTEDGVGGATALAKQVGIEDRVDVFEVVQLITANIYEWSIFDRGERTTIIRDFFERYNKIVDECEGNPSLKIEFKG